MRLPYSNHGFDVLQKIFLWVNLVYNNTDLSEYFLPFTFRINETRLLVNVSVKVVIFGNI